MIDLHTHTTASDGTDTPAQIIENALAAGLEALAITDHDTLLGSDEALPLAAARGLRLVRGLELSTRRSADPAPECRSVHILGYFFEKPAPAFRQRPKPCAPSAAPATPASPPNSPPSACPSIWRRPRPLAAISPAAPISPADARDKGDATMQHAFDVYLGETGLAYVEREDPEPEEGIRRIREAGGIASLAHAFRLNKRDPAEEESILAVRPGGPRRHRGLAFRSRSLQPLRYTNLARKYNLAMTGGSDYHGAHKPDVRLGRGRHSDWRVPLSVLDDLHARAVHAERRR